MTEPCDERLVVIRGAGDLATGVAWRLVRCGFPVVMTELACPLALRRTVSFAQAVYAGDQTVEGVTAVRADLSEVADLLEAQSIPVLVDPEGEAISALQPSVVVDAIMAKKNMGTRLSCAPLVVALGPGFSAGKDCHVVIETNRSHYLGRAIWDGEAQRDTHSPGDLPGADARVDRVLRAPITGHIHGHREIGAVVEAGSPVAGVWDTLRREGPARALILAPFSGVVRGLIHQAVAVQKGAKIGDLDPRPAPEHCTTISDKSLAVAGGVLEAILSAPTHLGTTWY